MDTFIVVSTFFVYTRLTGPDMIKAIAELFTEIFRFIQAIFLKNKAGDEVVKTARLYDIMNDVVHGNPQLNVHRFLIVAAHNGGKEFKMFTPQYSSCRHEVSRRPLKSIKDEYQFLPVDHPYIQLLNNIYLNKDFEVNTSELDQDSLLRNLYDAEGITYAHYFFIKHTKEEFVFGSISTADSGEAFKTPEQKTALITAIAAIRKLMR